MKTYGTILIWVMTGVLLVAVCFTAIADRLAFRPVDVEQLPDVLPTAPAEFTIDLNTATAEELEQLPGVGVVLAQRIVEYRETVGRFRRVEELLNVQGVGEKRLEQWTPYLVIQNGEPS